MTYVVTEGCIACKHKDCEAACPVDCFHEGPNFMVIDPEVCIDCHACVPACPEDAIFADVDVPSDQVSFVALNAELAKEWPAASSKVYGADLPDDKYSGVKGKLALLKR